jgi:hypothetical protein
MEAQTMARPFLILQDLADFAKNAMNLATSADEMRQALSITLSTSFNATSEQIADFLNITPRTVFRYRKEVTSLFENNGVSTKCPWGGRRN